MTHVAASWWPLPTGDRTPSPKLQPGSRARMQVFSLNNRWPDAEACFRRAAELAPAGSAERGQALYCMATALHTQVGLLACKRCTPRWACLHASGVHPGGGAHPVGVWAGGVTSTPAAACTVLVLYCCSDVLVCY
jgi:hypothetical protein